MKSNFYPKIKFAGNVRVRWQHGEFRGNSLPVWSSVQKEVAAVGFVPNKDYFRPGVAGDKSQNPAEPGLSQGKKGNFSHVSNSLSQEHHRDPLEFGAQKMLRNL